MTLHASPPREPSRPIHTGELPYQAALDGLRGIAVLAVLLYHGQVTWARGGFLGVDLFFVLSGYLITSLLLLEHARRGTVDLLRFWTRRARRLLPALLLVLLAVSLYSAVLARPSQRHSLRLDAVSTLGYVANWRFARTGQSYFDQYTVPSPLRHMWSLGIEEQYYLVFPLLLVAWLRVTRGSPRLLLPGLLCGAAASAAAMTVMFDPGTDPSRVYYGTDTRVQALLVGAALGTWATRHPVRRDAPRTYLRVLRWQVPMHGWHGLGSAALVVLIGLMVLARDESPWLYRGGLLLAAIVAAALIGGVTRSSPGAVLGRVLSWKPLVQVGLISYGLYLWHWPAYVVLTPDRTGLDGSPLLALRLAVSLGTAAVSYWVVERPVREGARLSFGLPVRPVAVSAGALALVIAAIVLSTGGPGLIPQASGVTVEAAPGAARVFLVGDSVAYGLWHDFEQGTMPDLIVQGSYQLGCGLVAIPTIVSGQVEALEPTCASFDARWPQEVESSRPDVAVLMLGIGEQFDRQVNGRLVRFGTPAYEQFLRSVLDERVAILGKGGRPVALVTVPCHSVPDSGLAQIPKIINDDARVSWLNAVQQRYATEHSRQVHLIDLHDFVCRDGYSDDLPDGHTMRTDGLHFSVPAVQAVWRWMGPQLLSIAGGTSGR